MDNETLIRMANQIADFFAPYTEEEGIQGVADHLTNFWEPRMRRQILSMDEKAREGLSPMVQSALERLSMPAG